jgi:hypothetical protein
VGHTVNYTGVEALTVSGNAASDTFNVTPLAVATFIDGGDPVGQLPATSHHPQTERQK